MVIVLSLANVPATKISLVPSAIFRWKPVPTTALSTATCPTGNATNFLENVSAEKNSRGTIVRFLSGRTTWIARTIVQATENATFIKESAIVKPGGWMTIVRWTRSWRCGVWMSVANRGCVTIRQGFVFAGMDSMGLIARRSRSSAPIIARHPTGCASARKAVIAPSPSRGLIVMIMFVTRRNCRCAIIMASALRIVLFQWDFASVIWELNGPIVLFDLLLFMFNYHMCARK